MEAYTTSSFTWLALIAKLGINSDHKPSGNSIVHIVDIILKNNDKKYICRRSSCFILFAH